MEAKLQQQAPQKAQTNKPNLTGIPTQMKLDFEQRSGLSFDDVRVHYNSDKPAQLQALAYTQGTQVYVGPRQERHLPHELGHVVQQKTKPIPTSFLFNHTPVNTDISLEHEANFIGQSRGKNCITGGSYTNNIIQAQFKIHTDTLTLIHVGRVNFSDEIKQLQGVSRNHFISNDFIVQAIQGIIQNRLDQRIKNELLDKNLKKDLLRLCDAVIPCDQMELKTSDDIFTEKEIYDDTEINQDRAHVLAIVERIKGIFTNTLIDTHSLVAFINELEFYLCNSRENLRYGNASTNSGIGSSLDIPTNVIYPTGENTLHLISPTVETYSLSKKPKYLVKIDLTDIDNHPLAKRLKKFLKLKDYFLHSDFLPKVRDIQGTPYLVSSDMDSDYVLNSGRNTTGGEYKSSEDITLHIKYMKSYPTDYRKIHFKGQTVLHELSFSTNSYQNTSEIVHKTIPERSSKKPKPPKVDDTHKRRYTRSQSREKKHDQPNS